MNFVRLLAIFAIAFVVASCSSGPVKSPQSADFERILEQAELGDPSSVHAACYGYLYGEEGASKDHVKAAHWCERASANGDPSSVTLFAEMHLYGNGMRKNAARARELFDQAAKYGHRHAQFMMARLFWYGVGGPRDVEIARKFVNLSAAQHYSKTMELKREIEQAELKQQDSQ